MGDKTMTNLLFTRCGAIIGSFVGTQAIAQTLIFADQTAQSGLVSVHAATPMLGMQFMAPGGAVGDFNGDGFPDVFVIGGSDGIDKLFINLGDGTFVDQASAWGVAASHAGTGAAAADYDGDGDLDIYVTSHGTGPLFAGGANRLYRNNGDRSFTNVAAEAGVADTLLPGQTQGDSFSPCWGDYDLDGNLDLAVAGWLGGNRLFRSNGDGTFTDVTASLNADMSAIRGFTPTFQDINDDRYPELLWVADFYTSKLFLNNTDGSFTDITVPAGVGLDSNGMGSTVGDFNSDGLVDWYATSRISHDGTNGSGNMLYLNNGDNSFTESSVEFGVNYGYWGWGTEAIDFNHDGLIDLVATNGFEGAFFSIDPTMLFLNIGDGAYIESADECELIHTGQGRGLATLDADRDGDMDLLIFCNNQPLSYFENQLVGPNANWLKIRLETSNRTDIAPHGYGTRVRLTAPGIRQTAWMDGGSCYLANSELLIHFGLGGASSISQLTFTWPTGETTTLTNIDANQELVVQPPDRCLADFAPPIGVLDFFDVAAFLDAFSAQDHAADLAPPQGVFDFFDIAAYLDAFSAGCP
jgi:enediyne biosynthesis protein E4